MSRRFARFAGAALLVLAGCGARGEPEGGAVPEVARTQQRPADTLVLQLPHGNSVWLAEGRISKDSAGGQCFERSVEIRRDSIKLKVPLLFTGEVPTPVNDSTFQARLYQNCKILATYKIGIRDGMPHKVQ